MKTITLKFLTEKGVQAYHSVEEAGKKESWKNRQISKKVCTDHVINKDPLTIEIRVKIPRLAVQIDLPEQIRIGLAGQGAVPNIDYTMDIQ